MSGLSSVRQNTIDIEAIAIGHAPRWAYIPYLTRKIKRVLEFRTGEKKCLEPNWAMEKEHRTTETRQEDETQPCRSCSTVEQGFPSN